MYLPDYRKEIFGLDRFGVVAPDGRFLLCAGFFPPAVFLATRFVLFTAFFTQRIIVIRRKLDAAKDTLVVFLALIVQPHSIHAAHRAVLFSAFFAVNAVLRCRKLAAKYAQSGGF